MTITSTYFQGKFLSPQECIDNHLSAVNAGTDIAGEVLTGDELQSYDFGMDSGFIVTPLNDTAEQMACWLEEGCVACFGTTLILTAEDFSDMLSGAVFLQRDQEDPAFAIVPLESTRQFEDSHASEQHEQELVDLLDGGALKSAASLEERYKAFAQRCQSSQIAPDDLIRERLQRILEMNLHKLGAAELALLAIASEHIAR